MAIYWKSARLFVSGFSGRVKSALHGKLINKYIAYFYYVVISGAVDFPIQKKSNKIIIHNRGVALVNRNSHCRLLLVYDVFMLCKESMRIIANGFCQGRYTNISVACLNQSLFHANPLHRTISLNSTPFLILGYGILPIT